MVEHTGDHPPDPRGIMALATAYWGSQALFAARRLGVFEALDPGPATAPALARRLAVGERALTLLLNACAALGLLEKAGERYANAPAAAAFLVPGRPAYMGEALAYGEDVYAQWGALDRVVREGGVERSEGYLGDDPERTRHFVYGMHGRALGVGGALVDLVDLADCGTLLDLGGGPGTYAALLLQRHPRLTATVVDLPPIAALAGEILDTMGVAGRVALLPGDYHEVALPAGQDAVLISGVLHRESPTRARRLIARAVAALAPGGRMVVSDVMTAPGDDGPAFATLFGLNMLLTAPDGGVHSTAHVTGWLAAAGLRVDPPRPFPPPMPHTVITATLP